MLDACYSLLNFCQSLDTLQRGLCDSWTTCIKIYPYHDWHISNRNQAYKRNTKS